MLAKLKKPTPERDRVVIVEEDGTADIATVYDIDDRAVYAESAAQDYAIPIEDLKSYVGPSGRIFILAADPDYVSDTKRLATLEQSIVLRQITHYQKPADPESSGWSLKQVLLAVMVGIILLVAIVT